MAAEEWELPAQPADPVDVESHHHRPGVRRGLVEPGAAPPLTHPGERLLGQVPSVVRVRRQGVREAEQRPGLHRRELREVLHLVHVHAASEAGFRSLTYSSLTAARGGTLRAWGVFPPDARAGRSPDTRYR